VSGRFTRRVEDFVCASCGRLVQGDGYTNHCPRCLWSKHVDVHPGDRAASCEGLMEPVAVILTTSQRDVLHRCTACGLTRRNQLGEVEDEELVRELAGRAVPAARSDPGRRSKRPDQ
jgi:predicted RNA-binding Zn-ribbon protein involved in translation (DUF1610 family)